MSTWKIARIAGIDISIHWSFLLLVAWVALPALATGSGMLGSVLYDVFLLCAVFGCVVLHELGHALAARQFGIGTRGITLLPIGGVASLERMPRQPTQELWIAVAGPLVNVAIAVAILPLILLLGVVWPISMLTGGLVSFLQHLMLINIVLVVFNMLPAFPMDGGRVLRSVLAMLMPYARATRIAADVGKFMAVLLAIVGLFTNPMLILLAAFVFLAGSAEARMAESPGPAAAHGFPHPTPTTSTIQPGNYTIVYRPRPASRLGIEW